MNDARDRNAVIVPVSPRFRLMTTRDVAQKLPATYPILKARQSVPPNPRQRALSSVLDNGAWSGSRAFIVGGGPSLRGFDFSLLKGEKTIVINRAFEYVEDASVFFTMDNRFFNWTVRGQLKSGDEARRKFEAFKGYRAVLDHKNFYPDYVYYIKRIERQGISFDLNKGLFHGNNSGFGALNLAIALRANPIYLLGYDMSHSGSGPKRATHFHSGYHVLQTETTVKSFIADFVAVAPIIRKHGFRVVNLNPRSALRCFEFGKIEDVFNGSHK